MANRSEAGLHGRFSPGTRVRLVEVEGPEVQRPGPQHETVDTQKVDDDGWVRFKGLDPEKRYFAVGRVAGQPVEVRLTPRASGSEDASLAEMYGDNGLTQRQRLSDGKFIDEERERVGEPDIEGATWPGQDQVAKGTIQRSDTPLGSAHPISAEELERATRQHRKQEPTEPVVERAVADSEDPATAPARTAKPAAKSPAKSSK